MNKNKQKIIKMYIPKTRIIYCIIDKNKEEVEYILSQNDDCFQNRFVEKIIINGFNKLPAGFLRSGKGLVSPGYLILQELQKKFDKFDLTIDKNKKSQIKKLKKKSKITINYNELHQTLIKLKDVIAQKNKERDAIVNAFLYNEFPTNFTKVETTKNEYKRNEIFHLLKKKKILDNLSEDDINQLGIFFPTYIKLHSDKLKGKEKILKISENRNRVEVVYLENIIKEYNKKLKAKLQSENNWQKFLREYILFFNLNYAHIIEKENISLEKKYPDFMLIDIYNYLDIYEIKTPATNLLKKDGSHGNYYWDKELSIAISQVENYINHINKNVYPFIDLIRKKLKLDIRIVKPRGFIIAGTKKQLTDEIMEDNFRLLNKSMHNVEVILYDEFRDNLKNLLVRLKK